MRVLTVLELLQARGRVSGCELAERLEVNQRTVQRYIARLQDLGAPVESTRGPGAGYRLKPGFRLPPLMFGTTEAFAIALGLEALAYLGLANVAPAAEGAQVKLNRVLPAEARARVDAVRETLVLELPRAGVETDLALLMTLAAAVHDQRALQMRYRKDDGSETERGLRPYGLMRLEGRWFLGGHCLLRQDLRLFRVDRIQRVRDLNESFERPAEFDMSTFLHERIALAAAPWEIEVWFDAPIDEVERRLPHAMAVLTQEGSGTNLRCTATNLDEIALILLQTGRAPIVRRPDELKVAFRSVAQTALQAASPNVLPMSPNA
jgi:predicted DNA-binding transcriptional regulator YafY